MKFPALNLILALAITGSLQAASVVSSDGNWRYRKGNSAPQADWKTTTDASLDASWLTGPGGFGYGDGDDATVLTDMEGSSGYRTVYIRKEFTITPGQLPSTDDVLLQIDYDDAYVAYLDGVEIARSSNAPGSPGNEPAYDAGPSSTREAGSTESTNLGKPDDALPAGTHVLAVLGMNASLDSSDFSLIVDLVTQAPPPPLHWTLADSPVTLSGTYSVASGQTLTIDAGVEVRCPSSGRAIDCDGVVIANGTEAQPIQFVPTTPGGTWGQLSFSGPSESRLTHCDFIRADDSGIIRCRNSDINLDHCRFIDVDVQMVDLVDSSCTIRSCEFAAVTGEEALHFSDMPSGGHALIAYNIFGSTTGYNDIIDFTGGNRPGPIVRFIGNTFLGGGDDVMDMDGTDAHIEGNIFINIRKDSSRSSSSNPITTGTAGGNDSELVIARNIFFNCEHNVMMKEDGSVIMQNNTSLGTVPNPVSNNTDADGNEAPGIIMFGEPWRGVDYPAGAIYEGNIAADLQLTDPWPLLSSADSANNTFLRTDHNCVEGFPQTGIGNIASDPLFVDRDGIDGNNILEKLALQVGSPCRTTGPNGLDMGALVPSGASISGEPDSPTADSSATLVVAGPGIWSYRWRLNGGAWSDEVSLVPQSIWDGGRFTPTMFDDAPPITLTGLAEGSYTVEVIGRNSAGDWQETPTTSKTWVVQSPDSDGDGMPDDFEDTHGLASDDPSDAALDKDGDGSSNLSEYIAGTDPGDPSSVLSIRSTQVDGPDIIISFETVSGKSYQLQSNDDLASGGWSEVTRIASAPGGLQELTHTGAASSQRIFYRLVTPAP